MKRIAASSCEMGRRHIGYLNVADMSSINKINGLWRDLSHPGYMRLKQSRLPVMRVIVELKFFVCLHAVDQSNLRKATRICETFRRNFAVHATPASTRNHRFWVPYTLKSLTVQMPILAVLHLVKRTDAAAHAVMNEKNCLLRDVASLRFHYFNRIANCKYFIPCLTRSMLWSRRRWAIAMLSDQERRPGAKSFSMSLFQLLETNNDVRPQHMKDCSRRWSCKIECVKIC